MQSSFEKLIQGYKQFREKYTAGGTPLMKILSEQGQHPEVMIIACSDSRVDPAVILQCDPGELFTVRNVANLVPPFEANDSHHGTSAALEYGINFLKVKHLILLGHSQCGGIDAALKLDDFVETDFLSQWVALVDKQDKTFCCTDKLAKHSLMQSYQNCLTFPWIKQRIEAKQLSIHRWFFNVHAGEITCYCTEKEAYMSLSDIEV